MVKYKNELYIPLTFTQIDVHRARGNSSLVFNVNQYNNSLKLFLFLLIQFKLQTIINRNTKVVKTTKASNAVPLVHRSTVDTRYSLLT